MIMSLILGNIFLRENLAKVNIKYQWYRIHKKRMLLTKKCMCRKFATLFIIILHFQEHELDRKSREITEISPNLT